VRYPCQPFPATIQSLRGAHAGPRIDGAPLRPGDILARDSSRAEDEPTPPNAGNSGQRYAVVETGLGGANQRVALFDPEESGRRSGSGRGTSIDADAYRVVWRSLATVAHLDDGSDERLLVTVGYDPVSEQFGLAWGRSPVASPAVTLRSIDYFATVQGLESALGVSSGPPLGEVVTALDTPSSELLDRLRSRLTAGLDQRRPHLGVNENSGEPGLTGRTLTTTSVAIPTGRAAPLASVEGLQIRPGDRFVYWDGTAPSEPLRVDRKTLATGHCPVVLGEQQGRAARNDVDSVTCYDLSTGVERTVDLRDIYERARSDGVALGLAARDCFVDPIGRERTYSVHVYRLVGREKLLLAGTRHESTTPRLEHPLSLPIRIYDTAESLVAALRGAESLEHPLSQWTDDHESVTALRQRVADRIETGAPSDSIPQG